MKKPKTIVSNVVLDLAFAAPLLPGLSEGAPSAPADEVLPVQPAAAWTVVPADPAPGCPDGNPHIRRVLDVSTPAGPGIRTEVEGESCICAACAKVERTFALSTPRSASGTVLEFHYDTQVTGFFAATSYVLEFYRQGALVGSRGFLGATGGIVDGCTRIDEASPLGEVTLFLDSFMGDAVFDAVKVSLRHYGCEMTGFQVISDLFLSSGPCPVRKVDHWVDAANVGRSVPPYKTRMTAATKIGDALKVAKAGAVIRVLAGTYTEPLVLGKAHANVTLVGDVALPCPKTILDGTASLTPLTLFETSGVRICGFHIINGLGAGFVRGGGVSILNSSGIRFEHCCFENNRAHMGGAVYAENSGGLFSRCEFRPVTGAVGNVADRAGGAVAIKRFSKSPRRVWQFADCDFRSNRVAKVERDRGGPGGAIAVFGDLEDLRGFTDSRFGGQQVVIGNCHFENNRTMSTQQGNNGGGFYCEGEDSVATMTDVFFVRNHARQNGGALAAAGFSTVTITGSTSRFMENTAPEGGALYATTFGDLVIQPSPGRRVTLEKNQAVITATGGHAGGAVHLTCGGIAHLTSCDFAANFSPTFGGAVHATSGHAVLRDCIFRADPTPNRAGDGGGAVALRSRDSGFAGPLGHFCDALPSLLELTQSRIFEASADFGRGGGILVEYGDDLPFKITQFSIRDTPIIRAFALTGLGGRPADGIFLRQTCESTTTLVCFHAAKPLAELLFSTFVRNPLPRYLGATPLGLLDDIDNVAFTARAPNPGSALAVDTVRNDRTQAAAAVACRHVPVLDKTVLLVRRCSASGFRVGFDVFESNGIEVNSCRPISGNVTGVLLDNSACAISDSVLDNNLIGIDIQKVTDFTADIAIEGNDITAGPLSRNGVQADTNIQASLLFQQISIRFNNITGHTAAGQHGVAVLDYDPLGRLVDATRNWWGVLTGANTPGGDNVTTGVDFSDPLKVPRP